MVGAGTTTTGRSGLNLLVLDSAAGDTSLLTSPRTISTGRLTSR
jgi:hypothetical protein